MSRIHFMTIGLPLMSLVARFHAPTAEPFREESDIDNQE